MRWLFQRLPIVHTSSPVNMQTIIRWYFISWIFSPN
ncbi:Uncharacterised protein [Vibrio cholerae]|nr:Uncharacterised protein [Vibrio cholerae]